MISVVLIGFGTVGKHLYDAFSEAKNVTIVQVYNRTESALDLIKKSVATATDLSSLTKADVYIIAATDDAIIPISKRLTLKGELVVHTSGSVLVDKLSKSNRNGSFYPLQTFSNDKKVDFRSVPICIEAENKTDLKLLQKLANEISDNIHNITSAQRKSLHLAAVFVNNFTNHLLYVGDKICNENNVPFSILSPLLKETINKLETLSPYEAQTGPAKRNDRETLEQHLGQLQEETYKRIYSTISNSIKETYGKKL